MRSLVFRTYLSEDTTFGKVADIPFKLGREVRIEVSKYARWSKLLFQGSAGFSTGWVPYKGSSLAE